MSKHLFDFEKEYEDSVYGEIIVHAVGYRHHEKGSHDCQEVNEFVYQLIEAHNAGGHKVPYLPDYTWLDEQADNESEEDDSDELD